MDLSDLTVLQRQELQSAVNRRREFYWRLLQRMNALNWSPQCPAYLAVQRAYDGAQALVVTLFHGGPPKPPP